MRRFPCYSFARFMLTALAGALCIGFAATAEEGSAADAKDVILARKSLMNSIMDKMDVIAGMISQRKIDVQIARGQASEISAMLMAFPHLFPPASNQWKENDSSDPAVDTIASPDIWTDFPDFYARSAAAWRTADELSRAADEDDIKRLNRALGIACDTCHALYLKE